MTPNQFLLYSILHKAYFKDTWLISLFAATRENETQKKHTYPGKLVIEPFGFFACMEDGQLEKIETPKKSDEPLFTLKDPITIDKSFVRSLKDGEKIETTVGRLMLNLICVLEPFSGKVPYWNKKFTAATIEDYVAAIVVSDVKEGEKEDPSKIYIRELVAFQTAVAYMEMFTNILAHSITRIGIAPAPGRKEFKKETLKRYEGKLSDPVEMAKFEAELEAFDNKYLKDDPAYGNFMTGKVKGARMTGYMLQGGASNNFSGSLNVTPIISSLEDGMPMDPESFTAVNNTTRYGSFARGAETVNGGVVAKSLMQAADNWRITKGDCGTKLGLSRVYGANDVANLIGRSYVNSGKVGYIENKQEAETFINRKIVVRSPQYCSRGSTQTCEVCAGEALSKYPTGLTIPLSELSGGILADSLKQMHASKLETVTMSLRDVIS